MPAWTVTDRQFLSFKRVGHVKALGAVRNMPIKINAGPVNDPDSVKAQVTPGPPALVTDKLGGVGTRRERR